MKKKSKKTQASHPIYRQGDVLIQRIADVEVPKGTSEIPREGGRVILAAGEVTGHHHAIRDSGVCFLRIEGETDRYLQVSALTVGLDHEEHSTITLGRGTYRVRIQREWSGATSRRVED